MCESLRTALGFNNNNNMLKYRIPQRTLSFGVGELVFFFCRYWFISQHHYLMFTRRVVRRRLALCRASRTRKLQQELVHSCQVGRLSA